MDEQQFRQLIDKYLKGNASAEEEQLLLNFFDSFQADMEWNEELLSAKQQLEDKMLSRLQLAISKPARSNRNKIIGFISLRNVAAAIIAVMAISIAYYGIKKAKQPIAVSKVIIKHDVDPGGNRATLTLSNGTSYVLDSAKNGVLAKHGNISIKKQADGQLVYESGPGKNTAADAETFNIMTTQTGGQYQVLLADGTRVWLNSESSLKYPLVFKGAERNVELTGEAYFEVAKNAAKPFNVKIGNMQVGVLGTHFNIMAYNNELTIKTTLLEGSVKITIGSETSLLKPGQQCVLNKSGQFKIIEVDVDQAIAWKNGYFQFDRSNIREIMNQLSRWYDTKVIYEGKIPDDEYVGKIQRSVKLSQVLHILELSHVHFRIENKNIIVTP